MARQTGAAAKIALKKQTNIDTLATGNFTQVPFYSTDFGAEQELEDVPLLGIAGTTNPRDPGQSQIGNITVGGGWVVPIDKEFLGYWLQAVMGNPTTTGTTNYTHVFKSGAAASGQNFFSVEHQFPSIPIYPMFKSVMMDGFTIEWSPSGLAQATFTGFAISETRNGSTNAGTLTAPTPALMSQFLGTVKRGGSALTNCVGATLNFSNNLDVVRSVAGANGAGNIDGADPSIVACRGQLRMRYADETLITAAIAQTSATIELAFTKSANESVVFLINNATLSRPKTGIPGPGGIELQVDFAGYGTATEMLTATLKNQTATYP